MRRGRTQCCCADLLLVCGGACPDIFHNIWCGNFCGVDTKALQRVVKSARKMTNNSFSALKDIYTSRCGTRAENIMKDPNDQELSTLLPSDRRLCSIRAGTIMLRRSFYTEEVRLILPLSCPVHCNLLHM